MAEERQTKGEEVRTRQEAIDALASQMGAAGQEIDATAARGAYDLLELMAGNMVLVRIEIGQWGAKTRWTPQEWGIEGMETIRDPEVRDAVASVYSYGERYLLPQDVRKALDSCAMRARSLVYYWAYDTPMGWALPISRYQEWRDQVDSVRTEYLELVQDIVKNLDAYLGQVRDTYRHQAVIAYRRSIGVGVNDADHVPSDHFVDDFVDGILEAAPKPQDIRGRFRFDVTVRMLTLPSMLEEETRRMDAVRRAAEEEATLDQAELDAKLDARRAVYQAMQADAVQQCRDLMGDILRQFTAHAFDVVEKARQSMEKNDGRLVGKTSQALHNLVAWADGMKPTDNLELSRRLDELKALMGTSSKGRDNEAVYQALKDLSQEARSNLLAIAVQDERQVRLIAKETDNAVTFSKAAVRRARRLTPDAGLDDLFTTDNKPRATRLV